MKRRTDNAKGEPKDKAHDEDEHRDSGKAPCKYAVNGNGALVLAALMRLDHTGGAHILDKGKAHIGKSAQTIAARLLFHLTNDVLDGIKLVLIETQGLDDQRVAFDELGGRKAQGDRCRLGMVLDQVCDTVDAAVKRTAIGAVGRTRTEVDASWSLTIARDVHGVLHELADAFVLCRRDGNHGHTELAFEQVDVDGAAIGRDLVHHVKSDDHRSIEFHKLEREVEVALDIGGIDDIDHRIGLRIENKLAAYDLLSRIRRERVDAGQVGDRRLGVVADLAIFTIDRHAREIAHMLVGARKAVEQRCLAAVLVAGKGKGDR